MEPLESPGKEWLEPAASCVGERCTDSKTLAPGHSGMCVAISFPAPGKPFTHAPCMDLRAKGEADKVVLSPFGVGKTFLPGMISVLTQ